MEYSLAISYLTSWLVSSRGEAISLPNGSRYTFVEIRRFEGNELKQLEERHGITLPSAYRDFLCCVGASWLFVDKSNENKTGLMFCRIDDLLGVFAMRTKESLSSVFSDCIPIGYDYDNGRVLAIAEALFAILCQCGGYVICNTRWAFVLRR